jgi:Fur family zinc uptake transcriptional regulator
MASVHTHPELPRNQALVLATLSAAGAPLSAYEILDRLRAEGLRAPLQVYRALDKLRDAGLVHRLESLNAFVACRHPDHPGHEAMAFAICDQCGLVSEIEDDRIAADLDAIASRQDFTPRSAVIELRGRCRNCA